MHAISVNNQEDSTGSKEIVGLLKERISIRDACGNTSYMNNIKAVLVVPQALIDVVTFESAIWRGVAIEGSVRLGSVEPMPGAYLAGLGGTRSMKSHKFKRRRFELRSSEFIIMHYLDRCLRPLREGIPPPCR